MENKNKSAAKDKSMLKSFCFVPSLIVKRHGGRTVYYFLGLPIWKIRRMEGRNLIKYYLFNIPILRFYYAAVPSATEVILKRLQDIAMAQQNLINELQSTRNELEQTQQNLNGEIKAAAATAGETQEKTLRQLNDNHNLNTRQIQNLEDRIRVYHAEVLERLDNLPLKTDK